MHRACKFVLIGILAAAPATLAGQNVYLKHGKAGATGAISGIVLGPDDKPAPHAVITYQSGAGMAPHAVHADAGGRFTITKLNTDNYDIRASAKGIFSEWKKNFRVQSGRTSDLTLRLIYAREMPASDPAADNKSKPKTKH
jgi:carboxypeptidase family protein